MSGVVFRAWGLWDVFLLAFLKSWLQRVFHRHRPGFLISELSAFLRCPVVVKP